MRRKTIFLGLGVLLVSSKLGAWGWRAHQTIGIHALRQLPQRLRRAGRRHQDEYLDGIRGPDRIGHRGYLPSTLHVLDDWGEPEREPIHAAVARLEERLRQLDPEASEWWFQAGRLVHLVSDLSQPLHTDRHPLERKVHGPFEAWVDKRIRAGAPLGWFPSPRTLALREPRSLLELARDSRRDYLRLMELFPSRLTRSKLERDLARWLPRAVQESARRIARVGRTSGAKASWGGSLPRLQELVLWLLACLLWIGRGFRPRKET